MIEHHGISSFWHAFINLWKGTMVLGILALSYDYNKCGDLGGFLLIIMVGVLSLYCYSMHLDILDKQDKTWLGFS